MAWLENGATSLLLRSLCAFPHPLQNRVPRVQVLLPLPKKSGIAFAVPDFFVSERKDLAARFARRPTCGACRGALVACGDRPAPTEAAAETKSFCPCHKTGGNTAFLPVFFLHVLYGYGVHAGSDSGFSHPFASARTCFHPLQHPERTRFRLFLAESGAFSFSRCFSGAKFLDWFLCILPYSDHRLKPSVIPCRREVSFLT